MYIHWEDVYCAMGETIQQKQVYSGGNCKIRKNLDWEKLYLYSKRKSRIKEDITVGETVSWKGYMKGKIIPQKTRQLRNHNYEVLGYQFSCCNTELDIIRAVRKIGCRVLIFQTTNAGAWMKTSPIWRNFYFWSSGFYEFLQRRNQHISISATNDNGKRQSR